LHEGELGLIPVAMVTDEVGNQETALPRDRLTELVLDAERAMWKGVADMLGHLPVSGSEMMVTATPKDWTRDLGELGMTVARKIATAAPRAAVVVTSRREAWPEWAQTTRVEPVVDPVSGVHSR